MNFFNERSLKKTWSFTWKTVFEIYVSAKIEEKKLSTEEPKGNNVGKLMRNNI